MTQPPSSSVQVSAVRPMGPAPGLRRAMVVAQAADGTVTVQNGTSAKGKLVVVVAALMLLLPLATGRFPVQLFWLLGPVMGWISVRFHLELRANRWRLSRGWRTQWFTREQAAHVRAVPDSNFTSVALMTVELKQQVARFQNRADALELVAMLHDYARGDDDAPCGCDACSVGRG